MLTGRADSDDASPRRSNSAACETLPGEARQDGQPLARQALHGSVADRTAGTPDAALGRSSSPHRASPAPTTTGVFKDPDDPAAMSVDQVLGELRAGRDLRELERALTVHLTRRETRRRLGQAKDLLAMEEFTARLRKDMAK